MNPTILPAMNRNIPFAIPNNSSLRYDITIIVYFPKLEISSDQGLDFI